MTYRDLPGAETTLEQLSIQRARELGSYLLKGLNAWAHLVGAVKREDGEAVIFELQVEVPQRPVNDIRPVERVAVLFEAGDEKYPEVFALREDFPSVPHLNLSLKRLGASLCLYDEPWHAVRLSWTGAGVVERIRTWLRLTAVGALHGDDQPLEPLMLAGSEKLVLPPATFESNELAVHRLYVRSVSDATGRTTFIADDRPEAAASTVSIIVTLSCPAQQHGVISWPPTTLIELHEMLGEAGFDLLSELRAKFREWVDSDHAWLTEHTDKPVILVVRLPKTRTVGGPIVTTEVRAFLTGQTLGEVGVDIGVWQMRGGERGFLLNDDTSKRGEQTTLAILDAMPSLSRAFAAQLSDEVPSSGKIVAVGVGALGSQVFNSLIRTGFGEWTLIDEDQLLPHNPARHALPSVFVGHSKATMMATMESAIFGDDSKSRAIVADVLRPRDQAWEVATAIHESSIIVDMSASIPVARYLAIDVSIGGRRTSVFLNPQGDSVAVLAEDKNRRIKLDAVEMQFYRLLLGDRGLGGFMADPTGRIRPGLSCRDVTSNIRQDMVAILAGIAGRVLRRLVEEDEALISVWRVQDSSMTVDRLEAAAEASIIRNTGGWIVVTDRGLIRKMSASRDAALPNETGGVLLGQFDTSRRIIYVFHLLTAPPDSCEWPTAYIRGAEGLRAQVDEASRVSGGMAEYVGEWHSHPPGTSIAPSRADRNVLKWVAEQAAADGHPGLIAIVGDNQRMSLHVLDGAAEGA